MIDTLNLGSPWVLLAAAFIAALLTRAAGVVLSGRVEPDTPLFDWFACVGQALVGGLMVRALFFSSAELSGDQQLDRAIAVATGFAVYLVTGRGLLAGTFAGVAALFALGLIRATV